MQATFEQFPTLDEMEQMLIEQALKVTEGNKKAAADLLGITRPTLHKRLTEHRAESAILSQALAL